MCLKYNTRATLGYSIWKQTKIEQGNENLATLFGGRKSVPQNAIGERPLPTLFGGRPKCASKYNREPTNHDFGQPPKIEHTVVERSTRRPKPGKYINFGSAKRSLCASKYIREPPKHEFGHHPEIEHTVVER